jgi:hypothetical protein
MTNLTVRWKLGCQMVRIGGGIVFGCMTSITQGGCPFKSGGMAFGTNHGSMGSCQWEAGRCVVENTLQPVVLGMTDGTVGRISLGFMVGCSIILYLMAS